jgi:hypothetical protein
VCLFTRILKIFLLIFSTRWIKCDWKEFLVLFFLISVRGNNLWKWWEKISQLPTFITFYAFFGVWKWTYGALKINILLADHHKKKLIFYIIYTHGHTKELLQSTNWTNQTRMKTATEVRKTEKFYFIQFCESNTTFGSISFFLCSYILWASLSLLLLLRPRIFCKCMRLCREYVCLLKTHRKK